MRIPTIHDAATGPQVKWPYLAGLALVAAVIVAMQPWTAALFAVLAVACFAYYRWVTSTHDWQKSRQVDALRRGDRW